MGKLLKAKQIYLIVSAFIGWFSVISQLYLNIINSSIPITEITIRFFSYFTILTNILVALSFTIILLRPKSRLGEFFSQPRVSTAVTAYITFVWITYNILLRHLWNPTGLPLIVDELLHSFIPFLTILFWLIFVVKSELQWISILPWMIYP